MITILPDRRFIVAGGKLAPHKSRLDCLNCGRFILPADGRQTTRLHPAARSAATTPFLLACPSCGHVYEYKLPHNLAGLRRERDSDSVLLRFNACECGESNCKFPVAVYTVLPAGIDAETEQATRRARWIFHGATCPFGHPLGAQQR